MNMTRVDGIYGSSSSEFGYSLSLNEVASVAEIGRESLISLLSLESLADESSLLTARSTSLP